MTFHVPEKFRVTNGKMGSTNEIGNNGAFLIRSLKFNQPIRIIASDGLGWEHVSVSFPNQCPSWKVMCFIKELFWDDNDVVMQLHPSKKDYVNDHEYCLHLWKPIGYLIPLPDQIMV